MCENCVFINLINKQQKNKQGKTLKKKKERKKKVGQDKTISFIP